ncbi:TRAP transporter substrate-binding protein DctP [Petroclostridium sp. X23]|uniref:TRAP transporter substrate-binding protein DctP n=1 Tax=Petroclostridium sp. X23 TaxID=3045146 RepID=UPI0024AE569F|nr:TRAP transporter substrate-binding protein DctP [Petroclostridium sp. X23]WHH58227.1 TRAP transporter substrate-binding protein DctP [Petroclostridium sp. X23]
MKKIRIALIFCITVTLISSLIGCGASDSGATNPTNDNPTKKVKAKVLKLAHTRPEGTEDDIAMENFAEQVNEKTNGSIKIDLYPANQLGDAFVVQERVGMGDVQMQLAYPATTADKSFGIVTAPYLVNTWEEAEQVYGLESELTKAVAKLYEKQGIKLIAVYPKYFGGIALIKEPKDYKDANVAQGLKIRVPTIKSFEQTAVALGYMATPLPFAEVFTSMQTGIIEGAIGSGAEGYYTNFKDLVKYYLPNNDHFEVWYLTMNMDLWNELTEDEQKVISDIASELVDGAFKKAKEQQAKYEEKLKEEGITVYSYTDEEIAAFAKKVREEVWPKVRSDYGEELFDSIVKSLK